MSSTAKLSQHVSDLFVYVFIPGLALILPTATSRWLIRKVSAWRWLMGALADAAFQSACRFVEISDEAEWKSRWKQVELLDVRDLYLMLSGRSAAVLAEIDCEIPIQAVCDKVMIGMHWGPSISILKLLDSASLMPAFPYRPTEKDVLRIRPFLYLFSRLAARYMVKVMRDRAVPVGGAGTRLRAMLDQPGSVVVLMDAPPMQGRSTIAVPVLGQQTRLNAGFPTSLAEKHKEYFFYAISLCADGTTRKKLELQGPFSSESAQAFLQQYGRFLDQHLVSDPAQWRIWHASHQFWE